MIVLTIVAVLLLAFANGANDNSKGVATLFGSGTIDYKKAINWATIATVCGSLLSLFFASALVKNFSGKELLSGHYDASPSFAVSVALGAALTVFIAARIGMPVSTTHALVGALTGAGLIAVGSQFNFGKLGSTFFLPLIVSPLIAAFVSLILYYFFSYLKTKGNVTEESCACVVQEPKLYAFGEKAIVVKKDISLKIGNDAECSQQYTGAIVGIAAQKVLDTLHFISAGAVSFARGLNDTPKILGILLIIDTLDIKISLLAIAIAMAIGGLLNARKVGETMGKKITPMNHGQGFTANLVAAILVLTASFNGLPVSATHVSVGSLIGIGIATGKADLKIISGVLLSWLLTLPVAAIISGGIYYLNNLFFNT